jgi:hypothetical protein
LAGVTGAEAVDDAPVPTPLVAVTVNVYAWPLVRPDTLQLRVPVVVQVLPSGVDVTPYPVIAEPPLAAGAVQETRAEPLPPVAVTPVGLPGTVAGVTDGDGSDAGPVPTPLAAVTVNVYACPLVRPLTVQLPAPAVEQVLASGEEVAV